MTSDLKAVQRPLKERYRQEPAAALITLKASGSQTEVPMSCSVAVGRAVHEAQAHKGAGGAGTAACSGDLLLGALAACAQVTCQMVAAAMEIPVRTIAVEVEGDLDLRGTLGLERAVPVGFQNIRLNFSVDAPSATPEQIDALKTKTLRYCVVYRTLEEPPPVAVRWSAVEG